MSWRLYPGRRRSRYVGHGAPPPTEVTLFARWTSWLVGFDFERHPGETNVRIHLGPLTLWIDRLR